MVTMRRRLSRGSVKTASGLLGQLTIAPRLGVVGRRREFYPWGPREIACVELHGQEPLTFNTVAGRRYLHPIPLQRHHLCQTPPPSLPSTHRDMAAFATLRCVVVVLALAGCVRLAFFVAWPSCAETTMHNSPSAPRPSISPPRHLLWLLLCARLAVDDRPAALGQETTTTTAPSEDGVLSGGVQCAITGAAPAKVCPRKRLRSASQAPLLVSAAVETNPLGCLAGCFPHSPNHSAFATSTTTTLAAPRRSIWRTSRCVHEWPTEARCFGGLLLSL